MTTPGIRYAGGFLPVGSDFIMRGRCDWVPAYVGDEREIQIR